MEQNITSKFREVYNNYKNEEERMGHYLKFEYLKDNFKVVVYSEEWDVYDGYDEYGSPYYYSYMKEWEDVSPLEFAQLMCFYLYNKECYDKDEIYCEFFIQ